MPKIDQWESALYHHHVDFYFEIFRFVGIRSTHDGKLKDIPSTLQDLEISGDIWRTP